MAELIHLTEEQKKELVRHIEKFTDDLARDYFDGNKVLANDAVAISSLMDFVRQYGPTKATVFCKRLIHDSAGAFYLRCVQEIMKPFMKNGDDNG